MKYKIKKIKQAQNEYEALTKEQKELLDADYKLVETEGIERVFTKKIEKDIFEIKTERLRSLYTYWEGALIIVVTIFVKSTRKTPEKYKKLARKRINDLGGQYD